jgi:stage IV sporulation protein FB
MRPVIRLRLFGIPLQIGLSFLVVVVLLGFDPRLLDPRFADSRDVLLARLAIWVGIVLVSVVAHELGHALTARRFGAEVSMRLYALGGLTAWSGDPRLFTPGRRVLIAAAGSAVGLAAGGLVYAAQLMGLLQATGELAVYGLRIFVFVNVIWGLINWLPIRPLDGGHILSGVLEAVSPRRGEAVADVIFLVTAVAGTILAYRFGLVFAALLGLWMAVSEFQRFAARSRPSRPKPPVRPPAPGEAFLFERDPPPEPDRD